MNLIISKEGSFSCLNEDLVVRMEKWYVTHVSKPNGEWNSTAEDMMLNFAESGHLVFRATSALERGEVKGKEGGKKSIHFNGSEENVELILRIVIYSQIHAKKLDPDSRSQTKAEIRESLVIPTEIPNANTISQSSTSLAQGDFLQEYERKFAELPDDQKFSKLCSDAGFLKEIGKGQFFITNEKGSEVTHNFEI